MVCKVEDMKLRHWSKLARLNTIPQSLFLVTLGAASTGIRRIPVKEFSFSAGLTAVSTTQAMLINDYQDYMLARDTAFSKPNKPMVTQDIDPHTVRTALILMYALICSLTHTQIRNVRTKAAIYLSNALLFLYTRYIKPITGVKNVFCAAIVSMAVGIGAFSVGGPLSSVWRPMLSVFGMIWHREILMDVRDIKGDEESDIRTLAVLFGERHAIFCSLIPLLCPIISATSVVSLMCTAYQIILTIRLMRSVPVSGGVNDIIESLPVSILGMCLDFWIF